MECTNPQNERRINIHLIRHGYAEHNEAKNTYGTRAYYSNKYRFSQLVKKGRKQAQDLRRNLDSTGITFDRVYTSPLDRAIQTTSILFPSDSDFNRNEIKVTDDLREINYAHPCNERKTLNALELSYPDFDYSLISTNRDRLFIDGDTDNRFLSIIDEISKFTAEWYEKNQSMPNIALVSHESFLIELCHNYLGINLRGIDNCEIVSFELDLENKNFCILANQ